VSFEVVAKPSSSVRPEIVSVSPTSFPANQFIGSEITITGNSLSKGVYASLYNIQTGWITLDTLSLKGNILKVKVPANASLKEVVYDLVLTNPGGSQGLVEKLIQVTKAEVIKEVLKEEPITEEQEVVEEPTAPTMADSAAVALLTEQLGFLKKQVVDLLKFFGRFFSSSSKSGVLESTYRYKIDSQSPNPFLSTGKIQNITVSVKNIGTATWYKDGVYPINLGTSNPLDRASIFATDSWFGNNNRPAALKEESVAPNGLATFVVTLKAPNTPGTYLESFKLVAENFVWLSGPEISWTITVVK